MILIFSYIIYARYFSDEAIIGNKNLKNVENIKVGMTKHSVLEIMGSPKNISGENLRGVKHTIFSYTVNNVDFQNIEIYFDYDGYVIDIFNPEKINRK